MEKNYLIKGLTPENTPCIKGSHCYVTLAGIVFESKSLYLYTTSLAVLVQVFGEMNYLQAVIFLSVGGMADYGGLRKKLLIWSSVLFSICAILMGGVGNGM